MVSELRSMEIRNSAASRLQSFPSSKSLFQVSFSQIKSSFRNSKFDPRLFELAISSCSKLRLPQIASKDLVSAKAQPRQVGKFNSSFGKFGSFFGKHGFGIEKFGSNFGIGNKTSGISLGFRISSISCSENSTSLDPDVLDSNFGNKFGFGKFGTEIGMSSRPLSSGNNDDTNVAGSNQFVPSLHFVFMNQFELGDLGLNVANDSDVRNNGSGIFGNGISSGKLGTGIIGSQFDNKSGIRNNSSEMNIVSGFEDQLLGNSVGGSQFFGTKFGNDLDSKFGSEHMEIKFGSINNFDSSLNSNGLVFDMDGNQGSSAPVDKFGNQYSDNTHVINGSSILGTACNIDASSDNVLGSQHGVSLIGLTQSSGSEFYKFGNELGGTGFSGDFDGNVGGTNSSGYGNNMVGVSVSSGNQVGTDSYTGIVNNDGAGLNISYFI